MNIALISSHPLQQDARHTISCGALLRHLMKLQTRFARERLTRGQASQSRRRREKGCDVSSWSSGSFTIRASEPWWSVIRQHQPWHQKSHSHSGNPAQTNTSPGKACKVRLASVFPGRDVLAAEISPLMSQRCMRMASTRSMFRSSSVSAGVASVEA
jgi:hypothetical protein